MNSAEPRTVRLPSGDIWTPRYGHGEGNVDLTPGEVQMEDAVQRALDQAGPGGECPWCGQKCGPGLRMHITHKHKNLVQPQEMQERAALQSASLRAAAE